MITSLVRWLGHWMNRATGGRPAVPPPEPTAEDDRGAGI
jgi:hypothetical protein